MVSFDLSITPPQIEYLLKPGATFTQAYNITNNSDNTIYLTSEVLPWKPVGSEGNVVYSGVSPNPDISFSLANADLKLNQPFVMPPNSNRQLVLKINASKNTPLNDYYYTFFITQNTQDQFHSDGNLTTANGRIGSHVLLSVSNTENPEVKGQFKSLTVTPKIKDIFLTPLTFKAELQNTSNHFYKISGNLTITKNDLVFKEFKLNNSNVLAHFSRSINCEELETCTLNPPFWPGRYVATLTPDQNLNIPPISVSFFIFPFSLLGIILLILFFAFLISKTKRILTKFFHKNT